MEIREALSKARDRIEKKRPDLAKELTRMFSRHERQINALQKIPGSHEALMKARERFKEQLKTFLSEHGASDLYEDMVGFVMGHISEIVSVGAENGQKS